MREREGGYMQKINSGRGRDLIMWVFVVLISTGVVRSSDAKHTRFDWEIRNGLKKNANSVPVNNGNFRIVGIHDVDALRRSQGCCPGCPGQSP